MKILICDDTYSDLRHTQSLVNNFYKEKNVSIQIDTFSNSAEALDDILNMTRNEYDLYILDVIMQQNGIDVAVEILKQFPNATIIFTTSSKEFAVDAFKVKALDYLIKPLNKNVFYNTLELFMKNYTKKGYVWSVKTPEYSIMAIELSDIIYIESCNRRLDIHLEKEVITTTSLRGKFLDSIPFNLNENFFLLCHNSFIVNMNKIKAFNDSGFLMKNGETVPISKRMSKQVKESYINYLVGEIDGNN